MRHIIFFIVLIYSCSSNQPSNLISNYLKNPEASSSIYYKSGEFEEMSKQFQDLKTNVEKRPRDIKSWLGIFDVYLFENRVTGDHQYAEYIDAIANELLKDKKINLDDHFKILNYQATAQLSLHEFEKGLATSQSAIKLMPNNASIIGASVDACVELGKYKEAVDLTDRMIALRPDLRSYSRVSYLRELFGDINGSINAMQEAVLSGIPGDEQTEWARVQLAKLYIQNHQADYAKMHLTVAMENRPNYYPAVTAMADLMVANNEIDEANQLLSSIPEATKNIEKYIIKAKISKIQCDKEKMFDNINTLDKLLTSHVSKNNSDLENKYLVKSKLKQMQTDHELKQVALEKAKYLVDIAGDADQALPYLEFEYRIRPNNIVVNKYLAKCYKIKGENDKAKIHLAMANITGWKDEDLTAMNNYFANDLTTN